MPLDIQNETPRRPIVQEDWNAVYKKSRFVRLVDLHPGSDCNQVLATALACYPPPCCLLPNVRSLHFDVSRFMGNQKPAFIAAFTMLLAPSISSDLLKDLTIVRDHGDAEKSYEIYSPPLFKTFDTRWTHLERTEMYICQYRPRLLATFAQIPTLESLELHFHNPSLRKCDLACSSPSAVPAVWPLRSLGLHGLTPASVAGALGSWQFPSLERFAALSLFRSEVNELPGLLRVICDHMAPQSLQQLLLRPMVSRHAPLNYEHIQPLAGFARLSHVAISPLLGVLITDEEHAQVASWWPGLQYLEFNSASVYDLSLYRMDTPATLGCLAHYARLCPDLQELHIPLTVRNMPRVPPDLLARTPAHPLSRLDVGDSPLDEACVEQTITFLRTLFPNVKRVAIQENEWTDTWKSVCAALV
ncbi:hypothetical protein HDZ31DRAFT_84857 [Schizophyllum fasciatum]